MISLMGFRLIEVQPLRIYDVARKHRKKRIAKKWRKRYGFKLVGFDDFMGENLIIDSVRCIAYGHPQTIHRVRMFLETVSQNSIIERMRGRNQTINESTVFGTDFGYEQS